jgi:hypothetical protein
MGTLLTQGFEAGQFSAHIFDATADDHATRHVAWHARFGQASDPQ